MIKYDEVISKCDGLKLDIAYIVPEGRYLALYNCHMVWLNIKKDILIL